tara:strand:+ start:754 stop:981 length:228 start_codon:yes stop_codon:yes gene_type:complete
MARNLEPVRGVGFTELDRHLIVDALTDYRPVAPPEDIEKRLIELLIDDFKGPSWDDNNDVLTPISCPHCNERLDS